MKKNSLQFKFLAALAFFAVIGIGACQKDDAFKSDKQVNESDNIEKVDLTEELSDSSDSIPPDDLPGPNTPPKKNRGWFGELAMVNCHYKKIEIKKEGGEYKIYVKMDLEHNIFLPDKDYGSKVEIWDYALEKDWWFWTTWHSKHVATLNIDKDSSDASATIPANKMFASKGIGYRELWIYLSGKYVFRVHYKILVMQKYSEKTKYIFDYWMVSK